MSLSGAGFRPDMRYHWPRSIPTGGSSVELIKILARACGHTHLKELSLDDLTTLKEDMARLSGVPYGGVGEITPRLT